MDEAVLDPQLDTCHTTLGGNGLFFADRDLPRMSWRLMCSANVRHIARFVLIAYAGAAAAPSLHLLLHAGSVSSADCRTVAYDGPSFSAPCENPNHHHDDRHDEHQCSVCRMANAAQAVVSPSWHIGESPDGTLLSLPTALVRHDIVHYAIRSRAPPLSCNS